MIFNSIEFLIFFPIVVAFYYIVPDKIKNYKTSIGKASCKIQEDGDRSVYLEDKELYRVNYDEDEDVGIRIVVFDNDSMDMVDQVAFKVQRKADIESDYFGVTGVIR